MMNTLVDRTDVSGILNDPTPNFLCDLFLAFLDMEKDAVYRRIKNAVLLCALTELDVPPVFNALAEIECRNATDVARSVTNAIDDMPVPIFELFNNYYCAGNRFGFMPEMYDADDVISFLGKTFLYLLETNYKY